MASCSRISEGAAGLAGILGGLGLRQRAVILATPFFSGTLGDTTAAFHIWPWPYRLAVVMNTPAFFGGLPLTWVAEGVGLQLKEATRDGLPLLLVPILWWWVGLRLDARSERRSGRFLILFVAACLAGAFVPLGYTGFIYCGVAIWIVVCASLLRTG